MSSEKIPLHASNIALEPNKTQNPTINFTLIGKCILFRWKHLEILTLRQLLK